MRLPGPRLAIGCSMEKSNSCCWRWRSLGLVMLMSWFITTSSFGRVLTAIREDEQAIEVFGYQATHYKLAVWVISADDDGSCGRIVCQLDHVHRPQLFHPAGVGAAGIHRHTGWAGDDLGFADGRDGPFVLLEEGMRFIPFLPTEYIGQARQVVLGILLVLLMLFRPQGLVGRYRL